MNLLANEMNSLSNKVCVLDGFPRRLSQALEFEERFPDFLEAVLLIDIPESVLLERIQGTRSRFMV
jgi:adenylate kinase family enzyme